LDLLSYLRGLSRTDLEAILISRPDAMAAAERPHAQLKDLAAILANEANLVGAISRLDRFHLQVLVLAASMGGWLGPATAAEQGVPVGPFDRAGARLSRLALAFTDGGGGLLLPDEVTAMMAGHAYLGPPLAGLLERESADAVRGLAGNLGVAAVGGKTALVTAVVRWFGDRGNVLGLLDQAPPHVHEILEAVRAAGGEASLHDLRDEFGTGAWEIANVDGRGSRARGPLTWLWSRGLVFHDAWQQSVVIPADVEKAIRGRIFETWEPEAPALETAELTLDRTPLAILEEVRTLLWLLVPADLALLKSGELGVRDRRRLASEARVAETDVDELLRLAIWAELIEVRTETVRPATRQRGQRVPEEVRQHLAITDDGRRWLTAEPAGAWLALFRGWLAVVGRRGEPDPDFRPMPVRALLDVVTSLPEDRGATVTSLGRGVAWSRPASFHSDTEGARAAGWVASWLHLLGIGPASPNVGLTPPGRAALRGAGPAEIHRLLPASVEDCTVQADLTVVVAGSPSAALGSGLARFADLQSSDAARVYRLTETSVRRGLDLGLTASEAERFLEERSGGELPSTVREFIRDVGRKHGRLRVGAAAVYVASEDAAALAEAARSSKLKSLRLRLVAQNVAVAEGRTVSQVMDALRRAGLMPVSDERAEAAAVPPVEAGGFQVPPMPASDDGDPERAAALAGRLLSTSGRGRSARSRAGAMSGEARGWAR
jgi:hypothetical protein